MNYTTKGKLIFRYPGGKSKISVRKKILTYFPDAYEEYREIMVGGGGIFFTIPNNINRWINDIDLNLMLVYHLIFVFFVRLLEHHDYF